MKGKYYQAEVKRPDLKKGTKFAFYVIRAKSEEDAKRFLQQQIKYSSVTITEFNIENRILFFFNELKKRNFEDNEFYPFYTNGYNSLLEIKEIISSMKYGEIYHLEKREDGKYYKV